MVDDSSGAHESLQLLLDAFVSVGSERDVEAILEQAVDLARLSTRARYGAAISIDNGRRSLFVHQGMSRAESEAMPHLPEGLGLLGIICGEKTAIRVDRLQDDPRSIGFSHNHIQMAAFLGVPVLLERELLGALYLTKPPGQGVFSDQDELFMTALARQVGVALDATRLFRAKEAEIAERAKTEAKLQEYAVELEKANAQLLTLDQVKTDFVSMASHELRTPLTSILGFASTILSYWDTTPIEDMKAYVEIIDRQAQRLSRLINALLATSRIESGTLNSKFERINMSRAIEQAVSELGERGADVAVECPDGLTALADADHVQQILVNYLGNAVNYGRPPIWIRATEVGRNVEVRVSDEGPGIAEEFVAHLFEKFSQADTGITRASGGTGLGLSIVKGLADAQQGKAWFEPNEPQGACFCIRLPAVARNMKPAAS